MIDLKHLRAFVAVAQTRHFTNAALQIGVSQPTLTASVRHLEYKLGVQLFHRTTREVVVTEMGAQFLPVAANLLSDLETAVSSFRDLAGLRRGRVTVAALPSIATGILPNVIKRFQDEHPAIEVFVIDDSATVTLEAVINGTADFAVGFNDQKIPGIRFQPIIEDTIVLMAYASHPIAARGTVSWSEIADEPIVLLSEATSVRKRVDATLAAAGIKLNHVLHPNMSSTVVAMVRAEIGLGVLPSTYLLSADMYDLKRVRATHPEIHRPLGVLTRKNRVLTPSAEAILGRIITYAQDNASSMMLRPLQECDRSSL